MNPILEEWKIDARINPLEIRAEIIKTSFLHSKYLDYLMTMKDEYRSTEKSLIKLRKIKSAYFKGEMGKDELKQYGWEQYQGIKPIKSDLDHLLSTDDAVIELQSKLISCKNSLDMIESILSQIKSRSYDLRNYVEADKFYNGN